MQIKKCIYLMKQLRIFFQTLYHTRQSFVMIWIPHGSTAKLKIWSRKKYYLQNNSNIQLFWRFQSLQNLLTATIEKSKEQFYSWILNKLMDPTTSLTACWSILKTFLNNKKIPCIPPIYHNNNYITDFKEKAEIFNNFFVKQCTIVNNTT